MFNVDQTPIQKQFKPSERVGWGAATVTALLLATGAVNLQRGKVEAMHALPTRWENLGLQVDRKEPIFIRVAKRMLNYDEARTSRGSGLFLPVRTEDGWSSYYYQDLARFVHSYAELQKIEAGKLSPQLDSKAIKIVREFYKDHNVELPKNFNFQSTHAYDLYFHIQVYNLAKQHILMAERAGSLSEPNYSERDWRRMFSRISPKENQDSYTLEQIQQAVRSATSDKVRFTINLMTPIKEDLERDLVQPSVVGLTQRASRANVDKFLAVNLMADSNS